MMVSSSILGHPSHAVGNGQALFPAWTVTALSKEDSDAHSSNQGNRRHGKKSKVCTADIFSALKQCPTLAMSLSSSGVRKTLDAPPPPGEAAAEAILRQERSPQALSLALLTSRAVSVSHLRAEVMAERTPHGFWVRLVRVRRVRTSTGRPRTGRFCTGESGVALPKLFGAHPE